ncbi:MULTISPECIES: GntR family transcriptional regulator [Enterococcus]|jgi:GntR family transcriptional regulator|uniref:GntR family transcriptional regulator n=1 Tax=Enterococcus dispar ATCC 51266 TaxID=1139219 RepID=S1NDU1_9ENTE|nr:GntR family transcriptional regulator [Enterococcus dispar]EOT41144.1 GntR family transcriptional regulator [Enterococcus dispar ATCC 51266]EOW87222.1 GntR family transcriptional regulator [Enterococcus dispar ATCC 51266]MCU7356450.1 GntR family transcriptional regulator [Enterococcus dispar]MDT2704510.1 GntR family transcriptional regulator [Enterococcus dispar]OJG38705.1 GntR family transcriptional regulator [Enterococcus dispar]
MSDSLPIYIQIHDQIKAKIEKGGWQIGDRLPSERELATQFSVSRMTLRQAIQTLADEGILERKIGSGTYVARQKVQEKMTGTTSFTEIMLSQGREPSSKVVSYFMTAPSSSEMEKLKLAPEEGILRMERIRFADGVPICFEVASIPEHLIKDYSKAEITTSFYKTLEEKGGLKIGGANQTISAMLASEQIAEFLKIKRGDAILRMRQISYLEDGAPFEYVRTQYVGNRFEFYLEK